MFRVYLLLVMTLIVDASSDEESFKNAYCRITCLQHGNKSQIDESYIICQHEFESKNYTFETEEEFSVPTLHCRDENQLTFLWEELPHIEEYLLEIRQRNSSWIPITTTVTNLYSFDNLSSKTDYQIRVWAIDDQYTIFGPLLSNWTNTLGKDDTPLNITEVWMDRLYFVDDNYKSVIKWLPNEDDRFCFYDIVWHSDDGVDFGQIEIREPQESFELEIGPLRYDKNYSVAIMARNGALDMESFQTKIHIMTPSCLEEHADLEKCPPPQPENVQSVEEIVDEIIENGESIFLYDITVSWDQPDLEPDNYIIRLTNSAQTRTNQTLLYMTVPGSETEAIFYNVELGLHYLVTVAANSTGGMSKHALSLRQISSTRRSTPTRQLWIVIGIVLVTTATLTLFCIGFFAYNRRARYERYQRRCRFFEELKEKVPKTSECIKNEIGSLVFTPKIETDCWEISPERIVLESVLGEGAFGLVKKGWLRDAKGNNNIAVAVKMLKESHSIEQTKQFLHEIEIMKSVGSHPNLVSIMGCITTFESTNSAMLVVEYCALGDLQNYLRNAWNTMISNPARYANVEMEDFSSKLVVNRLYELENELGNNNELQPCDLLSFARQIAKGMEFLSNLKVLHRDLAARNVLVCADKCVKVADFGLSRDVYKDNVYLKTGNSKLPIKWMAIESLTHQMYTSQSDVWSFGILLWEIVTLGGNPYPSIPTNELLKFLRLGYRMEKPANCGSELYDLMQSCWKTRPKDRPTFMELRKSLDKLLESMTTDKYLDLEVLNSPEATALRIPFKDSLSA